MGEVLPSGITLPPVAYDVAKRCNLDQSPVASIIGYVKIATALFIFYFLSVDNVTQVSSKWSYCPIHRPISARLHWRVL
jgi:hypothetical protein